MGLLWPWTQLVRSGSRRRPGSKTDGLIRIGIGVWLTVAEKEITESLTSKIAAKLKLLRRRRIEGQPKILKDSLRALVDQSFEHHAALAHRIHRTEIRA
jgi:hypothetical protein